MATEMTSPYAAYDLTGRVAVVTGAASGIGESTSQLLARAGAMVVCADINVDGAEATLDEIKRAGGEGMVVRTDVTSRADVEHLVATAVDQCGRLDAMCNMAGAMFPGRIEDLDDDNDRSRIVTQSAQRPVWHPVRHPGHEGGPLGVDRQRLVRGHRRALPGHRCLRLHQGGGGHALDDRGRRGRRVRDPGQCHRAGHDDHALFDLAAPQARRHARPGGLRRASWRRKRPCPRSG